MRPVPGVLPAAAAAVGAGFATMVVAPENAAEAALVPELRVLCTPSLGALVDWLRGVPRPRPAAGSQSAAGSAGAGLLALGLPAGPPRC